MTDSLNEQTDSPPRLGLIFLALTAVVLLYSNTFSFALSKPWPI